MQQPVSEADRGTVEELRSDAKQLGSSAANYLHGEADARKGTVAEQARTASSAIQNAASELEDNAPDWLKSTLRQGADQIQRLADTLEQKDSRQILEDVQSFARERPAAFLAACAAAGFAAARVFKAGAESSSRGSSPPSSNAATFPTESAPAPIETAMSGGRL